MDKGKNIIKAMLKIYCQAHHANTEALCLNCEMLRQYAVKKLENCPFGKDKPVCSKCSAHCYSSENRDLIRKVMLFSGPRMIFRHPVLAMDHMLKTFKKLK
jgi:hypothetical protein